MLLHAFADLVAWLLAHPFAPVWFLVWVAGVCLVLSFIVRATGAGRD